MPDWRGAIRRRLSGLRLSPERELDIVDELTQHLDDRWRELMAGGQSPDQAERVALAELGNDDRFATTMATLQQARIPPRTTLGASAGSLVADAWQDVRYARRTLMATPGIAAVAVLSLALGIGANTAIFSLWNGLLHAPLPIVNRPEELVILSTPGDAGMWTGRSDGIRQWLSYAEFEQIRDQATSFSGVMASQSSLGRWQVGVAAGGLEEASGRLVSGGFFQVLGVRPALGRLFAAADDDIGIPELVISDSYWRRRFGARSEIVGQTLRVRNIAFTIVGVTPPGFVGETSGQQPDLWLPLRMQPTLMPGRDRLREVPPGKAMWLHVFGRLKPGITPAQADAEANAIFLAGLESFYGEAAAGDRRSELLNQRLRVMLAPGGASPSRGRLSTSLTALLAAVGVLLVIACTNLANLLLARGAARKTEIAIRLSLGASRSRIIRQLLTESAALAAVSGVVSMAAASLFHHALTHLLEQSDPDLRMVFAFDPPVLVFALAATIGVAALFGGLPAWQLTSAATGESVAGAATHGRGGIGSCRELRWGRWLVGAQIALSLPLLVGAGLLVRTVYNLQHADLGFAADRLLLVRVDLRDAGYPAGRRDPAARELLARIQQIPGVTAASFSQLGLFTGGDFLTEVDVEGYTRSDAEPREVAREVVGPRYLSMLGVPLRRGRDIVEGDRDDTCVLNEAFAARFFGSRDPIGRRVTMVNERAGRPCTVVGVVGDSRRGDVRGTIEPRFYVGSEASTDLNLLSPTFTIRAATPDMVIATDLRRTIQRFNASLPIVSVATLDQQVAPLLAQDRVVAEIALVFGAAALVLAAMGLYGVLSYGVARRREEIAIRMALGAPAATVVRMIMRELLVVMGYGLAMGLALSYAASRLVASRLYDVPAQDPWTLLFAATLLLLVGINAAYLPARRAARLNPIDALRQS